MTIINAVAVTRGMDGPEALTLTQDTQILVQVRIELPATLTDEEARRVAEAEALRRLTALPWVIAAVPVALRSDDESAIRPE